MADRIALVAPMHSGKTTLANLLVERGYRRIALADALKYAAMWMLNDFILSYADYFPERKGRKDYGHGPILIDREEIEEHKAVFRPFLQWLGTDFARQYLGNDRVWIDMFLSSIVPVNVPVVCDDVRFPNEAEALRAEGFRILRIIRPEEDRRASVLQATGEDVSVDLHVSESRIDDIRVDDCIHAGNLAELRAAADLLCGAGCAV
ncbi:MAG: hypothetical protein IT304_08960 [Dehalococcoidia bacterium]|nr:hypothetical protein [Dehalococcoidia bacterium]